MKVLVIRFSALGDLVLTTGPIREFREQYPEAKIDFLTSDLGAELIQTSLDIERTIVIEKGSGFLQAQKVYRGLGKYDAVIDLHGSLRSRLFRFFNRSPFYQIEKQSKERRAFVKKRKYKDRLTKHVVEKYYEVFKKAFELEDRAVEDLRPSLHFDNLTFNSVEFDFANALVIHPYASQKNKEWPHTQDFIQSWPGPKVIVGRSDEPTDWSGDKLLDLTNKTSIGEMGAIIKTGKALLTTDSGPMHMGIAAKRPTYALFGPTTKEFGFYPTFKNTQVFEVTDLDCRPCHVHGGNLCPKEHFKCMQDLSADQITKAIKEKY